MQKCTCWIDEICHCWAWSHLRWKGCSNQTTFCWTTISQHCDQFTSKRCETSDGDPKITFCKILRDDSEIWQWNQKLRTLDSWPCELPQTRKELKSEGHIAFQCTFSHIQITIRDEQRLSNQLKDDARNLTDVVKKLEQDNLFLADYIKELEDTIAKK